MALAFSSPAASAQKERLNDSAASSLANFRVGQAAVACIFFCKPLALYRMHYNRLMRRLRLLLATQVLGLCVVPAMYAAEIPRAQVFLSWIGLIETDTGWRINHVHEMGDYTLPLVEGDVLTKIEGRDASTIGPISLVPLLEDAIFHKITVTVERNGQPLQLEILLADSEEVRLERYAIGVMLVPGPGGSGVAIAGTHRGGPADKVGLKKNDMILAVDGIDVTNFGVEHVYKLITVDHPGAVKLRVLRGKADLVVVTNRVSTRELGEGEVPPSNFPIHKRGEAAPNFSLTDTQGQRVSLDAYRGQWVLVNFWGVWCAFCHVEMPFLEAWSKQYAGKLTVLGIDINDKEDSLKKFLKRHPIPYEVLLGGEMSGALGRSYALNGAPLNIVVDPNGAIRYLEYGFESASPTDPPPLESFLQSIFR